MTKCDFCVKQQPNGQCYYNLHLYREEYCKKAIKLMASTLKRTQKGGNK